MRTYDVDGHQVQLLATQDTGLWITDTWEDLDRPVGDVFRVGNVLTVRPGGDLRDGPARYPVRIGLRNRL